MEAPVFPTPFVRNAHQIDQMFWRYAPITERSLWEWLAVPKTWQAGCKSALMFFRNIAPKDWELTCHAAAQPHFAGSACDSILWNQYCKLPFLEHRHSQRIPTGMAGNLCRKAKFIKIRSASKKSGAFYSVIQRENAVFLVFPLDSGFHADHLTACHNTVLP